MGHPTWTEQLPEAMRTDDNYAILDKYDKLGDFAQDYLKVSSEFPAVSGERDELKGKIATYEDKIGKMVTIPNDESTDEEKNAFYNKFGVPETIEEYGFDELSKTEAGKKVLEGFKGANLNKKQAKFMSEFIGEFGKAQAEAYEEESRKAVEAYKGELGEKAEIIFKNATDAVSHFFDKGDIEYALDKIMSDPKQIEVFSRIGTLIKESPRVFSHSKHTNGSGVIYESMKDLD